MYTYVNTCKHEYTRVDTIISIIDNTYSVNTCIHMLTHVYMN